MAVSGLADAGLGDFDLDPQLDLAQHGIEAGIAGVSLEPVRRHLELGERRRSTLPSSSPILSASSTSSALRPLATARFLRSVGSLDPLQRDQRIDA